MQWHSEKCINHGVLRHPADVEPCRNFDNIYNEFALEPRNVRLRLATNGFNPFGNMNITFGHSFYFPIIFPQMCMKGSFI